MHTNMKEDFNCNDSIPKVIISKTTYMVPETFGLHRSATKLQSTTNKMLQSGFTKGEMLAIESENVQQRYVLRGCWV